MRKLTLLTLIFLLSIAKSQAFSLKKPDYSYNIYSDESSIKIYEFTPKSNLGYTCIVIVDDINQQLECFPKK